MALPNDAFDRLHRALRASLDEKVAPLSSEIADLIAQRAANTLALVPTSNGAESVGCFGGPALLDPAMDWARSPTGAPLDYLGFLDCAALQSRGSEHLDVRLPEGGVLFFFVEHLGDACDPVRLQCERRADVTADALRLRPRPASSKDDELFGSSTRAANESLADLHATWVDAVPSLSIPKSLREVADLVRASPWADARLVVDQLDWAYVPSGAVGQVGGWANAHDLREDVYRDIALHALGRPSAVAVEHWRGAAALATSVREAPRAYRWVTPAMHADATWAEQNALAIADEANRWSLLLRLWSNREMDLLINDSDPLMVFAPTTDIVRGDFSRAIGRVLQT